MQIQSIRSEMGRLACFLILLNIVALTLNSQDVPTEYSYNIKLGDSLFKKKQYSQAGVFYNSAFRNKQGYSIDYHRLQAAYTWAKANCPDSAFFHLNIVVYSMQYSDCSYLRELFASTSIYGTSEFKTLLVRCECQYNVSNRKFRPDIARILDSVYLVDQSTRSLQKNEHVAKSNLPAEIIQSRNLTLIDSLYQTYGWLSTREVGYNASLVQFLVIQHADLKNMQQRFARIQQAVESCLLAPENLALMEDKILVFKGLKQKYGSQLQYDQTIRKYVPLPIDQEDSVDARRFQLGMISLQAYLDSYNL